MRFIFSFYIVVIILTILIIVIGFAFSNSRDILQKKSDEQHRLEVNLARVQQDNEEARQNIELLNDEKILEQEARKRFHLKKEGEEVVVIYSNSDEEESDRQTILSDEEFLQIYDPEREGEKVDQSEDEDEQNNSITGKIRGILQLIFPVREEVILEKE